MERLNLVATNENDSSEWPHCDPVEILFQIERSFKIISEYRSNIQLLSLCFYKMQNTMIFFNFKVRYVV